ncbi:Lysosomal aspartic protease [Blattella germanica]|nr:Lysosomal aspartic protease [Blattella germanica]
MAMLLRTLLGHNEPGSELIIGGSDPDLYEGELTNLTVMPNSANYLMVSMPSLKFDGVEYCPNGCRAVLDTGTTNIGVPSSVIGKMMNTIVKKGACSRIPQLPTIYLSLEDTEFSLESEFYMNNNDGCGVGFYNSTAESDFWVLGTVFLQKYYTKYDLTQRIIGIAPAV